MVLNSGRLPMLPYPYLKGEGGPDDGIRHGKEIFAEKLFCPKAVFGKMPTTRNQQAVWLEAQMFIWEKHAGRILVSNQTFFQMQVCGDAVWFLFTLLFLACRVSF